MKAQSRLVVIAAGGSRVASTGPRGLGSVVSKVPGSYWYTRIVTMSRDPLPIVPRVMRVGQKAGPVPLVYFDVRTSTETWVGQDGTIRQRTLTLSRRFATAADRRRWNAADQRLPDGTQGGDSVIAGNGEFPVSANVPAVQPTDPGDGLFSYRQLLTLPLTTAKLRARLVHAEIALTRRELDSYVRPGPRHAQTVSILAHHSAAEPGQLYILTELLESPIPQQLRLALVAATADLPGVKTSPSPSSGRIVLTEGGSVALTVTVNTRTGELISTSGPYAGASTVLAQGPTASDHSLPNGVASIPRHASVPPPTGMTVAPSQGTSRTDFRIETPRINAITTAPLLQATMFGPTGPDCTFWASHAPSAIIRAGHLATAASQPVYEYSLPPSAIHRTTWCPGTYEMQITPIQLTSGASKNLAGPSAAYFTVRR
jgi:hypothetical protein